MRFFFTDSDAAHLRGSVPFPAHVNHAPVGGAVHCRASDLEGISLSYSRARISDLGWERYKYVVQVVVGEQRGEGIK